MDKLTEHKPMDKQDWEISLKKLKDLKQMREKDLEEITFTVECYEKKVKSIKDIPLNTNNIKD